MTADASGGGGGPEGFGLYRICITPKAIAEVVDRTPLVSIPRSEVRKLRVVRGYVTERPWILGAIGGSSIALGLVGLAYVMWILFGRADHARVIYLRPCIALLGLVFGPIAIAFALRRGVALIVETTRTARKLTFGAQPTPDELAQFAEAARAQGLEVEVEVEVELRRATVRRA